MEQFLLLLSSKIICDRYDDSYFNDICNLLKDFCEAEEVIWSSKKKNFMKEPFHPKDVVIETNHFQIVLKNVKKELENKEFFVDFLKVMLDNVSKNRSIIEQLKKDKYTDTMLHISNRSAYEELLKENHSFSNIGLAFIDVNYLGVVNNMYGYEAGDLLLKTTISCFVKHFRRNDIYRIGGDEFLLICENIKKDLFQKKLEESLQSVLSTDYTVSYGVVYQEECDDFSKMVKEAEKKMKAYKENFRETHPEQYLNKYEVKYKKGK